MKKDVLVNSYITSRKGEHISEKLAMLEEAKKDLKVQYETGAISKEQLKDGLKELKKQYPLSSSIFECNDSIVSGYRINKTQVDYDGKLEEDMTAEYSSTIYEESQSNKLSKSDRILLKFYEESMMLYGKTLDETYLTELPENIAAAIVNLVNIGGHVEELHDYLLENHVSLCDEAGRTK